MTNISDNDFSEFALGFYAPSIDKSSLSINELLESENHWHLYMGILLSCERGQFSALERLGVIFQRRDSYLLWQAASYLAGFAGNWDSISRIITQMEGEISKAGTKYFMSSVLSASCCLRAVPPLLRIHSATDDEDERIQIEDGLSYLLEDRDGEIRWGLTENAEVDMEGGGNTLATIDRPKYFDSVGKRLQELLPKTSNGETAIFEGNIYDAVAIAQRLHKKLIDQPADNDRLHQERLVFEAATGVDCTSFYSENGALAQLAAISVMESFFDSDKAARFVPGQRYFFGHPIDC